MASLDVRPVGTRADLKAFINLAWDIYAGDSRWVPPTRSELTALLTPGKHPFWQFSRRELFIAWRDGRPVGRIAAIIDENHNRRHNERMGAWGFFECVREPEVAAMLFQAAEGWLRQEGAAFMRGPLNPSLNYEMGLLIEGCDQPPALMMAYNPPYYAELVVLCGLRKEKDVFSYVISRDDAMPEWAISIAAKIAERGEFTIRHMTKKTFEPDVLLLNRVYEECWGRNWGFVPMSDPEIRASAALLKHFVDLEFAFFAYHGDIPIGVGLFVPDVNPLLRRFNGGMGLGALVKSWVHRSDITGLRCLLFGVKEEYRQMGVPLLTFDYLRQKLAAHPEYKTIELGWTLEDNSAINLLFTDGGFTPQKRYRLFRKDLETGRRG